MNRVYYVISDKTLFFVLFSVDNCLICHQRFWVCFVHILDKGCDNLNPRALKCVFLRYGHTHKDYQSENPSSRKYIVCGDVTFEITSYFY